MKTKTLHKQLMSFGLSRNEARRVIGMARGARVSNAVAFDTFCYAMMEWLVSKATERLDAMAEAEDDQ